MTNFVIRVPLFLQTSYMCLEDVDEPVQTLRVSIIAKL